MNVVARHKFVIPKKLLEQAMRKRYGEGKVSYDEYRDNTMVTWETPKVIYSAGWYRNEIFYTNDDELAKVIEQLI